MAHFQVPLQLLSALLKLNRQESVRFPSSRLGPRLEFYMMIAIAIWTQARWNVSKHLRKLPPSHSLKLILLIKLPRKK